MIKMPKSEFFIKTEIKKKGKGYEVKAKGSFKSDFEVKYDPLSEQIKDQIYSHKEIYKKKR